MNKPVLEPKPIPNKRGNRGDFAKKVLSFTLIGVGCLLTSGNKYNYLVLSTVHNYLFFAIIKILTRLCDLVEEYNHLQSLYDGNIWFLLKEVFYLNTFNNIALPVASVIAATCNEEPITNIITKYGIPSWICSLAGVHILTNEMMVENDLDIAKFIDNFGLDYGSGMAHSFFHGYLNLILPNFGDERVGLKELIERYVAKNEQVKFAAKKLYLFIPLSTHCPHSIDEIARRMEKSSSLEWIRKDRGGVIQRQYHNSVYKLHTTDDLYDEPLHVCAEYASPLLTLNDVIEHSSEQSRRFKRFRKEFVTNFYNTLSEILKNSPKCRDLCELIYYSDIDTNGEPLNIDVGELLLERVLLDQKNAAL